MEPVGSRQSSPNGETEEDDQRFLQVWLDRLQTADSVNLDEIRGELIHQASLRLETLARRMLRNYPRLKRWEQTDDVLQNSLLRLHHALSTIRPESVRQFFGLAATQIRRELIDLTRHHFGPEGAASRHHTDDVSASEDGLHHVERSAIDQREPASLKDWSDFHEAVQRLPSAEREVFELYWYEGMDQKAIATLLGVTDRTIKNRWRQAKLLLQQMLNGGQRMNDG